MNASNTPVKLDLKKDSHLEVVWQDGHRSVYKIDYLRTMCPCAQCKNIREADKIKPKTSLTILPGNFVSKLSATGAKLVGNYALQIEWSDEHGSGIYSFDYLRLISPAESA